MVNDITLEKGERISLEKVAPGVTKVRMDLSWDPMEASPHSTDLDTFATLLDADGKAINTNAMVFYGMSKNDSKLMSACKSVLHTGDNLTGAGDGVDESIKVDLALVPANCESIEFGINIYQAAEKNQNFGQVKHPKVAMVDDSTNTVLKSYEPDEDFSTATAIVIGTLYRREGNWSFKAVGEGSKDGLVTLRTKYGM